MCLTIDPKLTAEYRAKETFVAYKVYKCASHHICSPYRYIPLTGPGEIRAKADLKEATLDFLPGEIGLNDLPVRCRFGIHVFFNKDDAEVFCKLYSRGGRGYKCVEVTCRGEDVRGAGTFVSCGISAYQTAALVKINLSQESYDILKKYGFDVEYTWDWDM